MVIEFPWSRIGSGESNISDESLRDEDACIENILRVSETHNHGWIWF